MNIGDTIELIPKTRHGKNRVHEHGNTAKVVHMKPSSFSVETPDGDWRWIIFLMTEILIGNWKKKFSIFPIRIEKKLDIDV